MNSRTVVRMAGIAIALGAAGCRGVNTPSAVVAPQIAAASTGGGAAFESASLLYACAPSPATATAAALGAEVVPASHLTSAEMPRSASGDPGPTSVLAVRFPHPEGRPGLARAELITVEHRGAAAESWRTRLGRAIDASLPGVEWGPGIRQAKGLDVPVGELQGALAQVPGGETHGASASLSGVRLTINGEPRGLPATAGADLSALAARVEREGRLISYPGDAASLLAAAAAAE